MGSMGKGGLYKIWVEKYGTDVANEKMKEYKEKMSKRTSGENNHFFGKNHTQESLTKMSKALSGKPAWNRGVPNPDIVGDKNPAKRIDVRKKISNSVKGSYNDELRDIRSKHFKKLRERDKHKHRILMEERGVWRKREDIPEFERYRTKVRNLTQKNYTKYFYIIDPERKRGRKYHLDHIYSIAEGFENGVDPKIISHPCNLRIVYHSINESKCHKSDISLEKLMENINEFASNEKA